MRPNGRNMEDEQRLIDVSGAIGRSSLTRFHYLVFTLCGLVALMDGYDSVIIGITAPSIAKTLGLDVKTFGPIFAAAQFGFMAGAFVAGPIADRFGRKLTLVAAALLFGVSTALTTRAGVFGELVAYRFVTGLGLGAAATSFVSLAAELAPERVRGTVVAVLWTLVPGGNVVGGLLASVLIPAAGWQSVYLVGGLVPILVGIAIAFVVPESVSFLAGRDPTDRRIGATLARLVPEVNVAGARFVVTSERADGFGFVQLFNRKHLPTTACIWVSFFCTWLILITTLAWISPLVQQGGLGVSEASLVIACNSGGGVVGALLIGRFIDVYDKHLINVYALFLGALSVGAFGLIAASLPGFAIVGFLMGFFVGGASAGMMALVALSYPTALRSTGVGWGIAVARLGSAVGPIVAGSIMSAGGGRLDVFSAMAACAIVAAAAIYLLRSVGVRQRRLVSA